MTRPFLFTLALCFVFAGGGCNDHSSYDLNIPLMIPDPAVVKLPYEETLNKGGLRISVRAIPGRIDAVQVVAKMSGFYESPTLEWMQEDCSVKKLPLDRGLERYDI